MSLVLNRSDVSALGSLLRGARERRGLTVQEIAAVTRIPRRHLDALEQGRLEEVPTGMYRRAEVRAFAEAVGLDRNVAIAQLERALGTAEAPPAVVPPAPDPLTLSARARIAGLVVVAVLVAGGAYWLWLTNRGADSGLPTVTTAAAATSTGAPTTARADDPETPAAAPASVAPAARPSTDGRPPSVAPTPAIGADAPSDGGLSIASVPSGARVLVNGIGFGQTPLTIRHLEPGPKRVRLLLDGHASVERTVRVGGQEKAVNVTLRPID